MQANVERGREILRSDEGQIQFLKVRSHIAVLLNHSGAFTLGKLLYACRDWDPLFVMACIEKVIGSGEIEEVERETRTFHDRLFVRR